MIQIIDYICKAEGTIELVNDTIFIDMFAVQTPKQGQKLGSKLMRKLLSQCKKKHYDVYLFTNTKKNNDIYNHFGFETVKTIYSEELNSYTYYLLWKYKKTIFKI